MRPRDEEEPLYDDHPFEPSATASGFGHRRWATHLGSSGTNGGWRATLRSGCVTGRIPLCLVLVLILAFLAWHVETEPARLAAQLAAIEHGEAGDAASAKQHELLLNMKDSAAVNPRARLPVKSSYRVLLVGDSLTAGLYRDAPAPHPYGPYLANLLRERHPHLSFEFDTEAEGGECVISACTRASMIDRVTQRLQRKDAQGAAGYYDLAIIMGGTNDIFHDFSASDISHGLATLHSVFWSQTAPAAAHDVPGARSQLAPKTLALTVPQWGDSEAWRPERRPTKLPVAVAAQARMVVNRELTDVCTTQHSEQCTLVDLDAWFPRRSLKPQELQRKWADDVHPTPFGYDEIALIVYQQMRNILPLN